MSASIRSRRSEIWIVKCKISDYESFVIFSRSKIYSEFDRLYERKNPCPIYIACI